MEKILMPKGARYIIEQLQTKGYEAYIVGGCVRDSLLNRNPSDWDITTSAKPEQVKEIFSHTVDTGIQHGTVTVLVDKEYLRDSATDSEFDNPYCDEYAFEVTTYRVDGIYEDHRRPKDVSFTANLHEDLKRRDFTINAMAYNDKDGVVDIFGGIKDLSEGVVRCVGNAIDRFDEDALRVLRAVRFSAQLGFDIEQATKDAIIKKAIFLRDISAERIQVELTKLITSPNPYKLVTAYELGITKIVFPEFDFMMNTKQNNPHHMYNVGMHTIKVMENVSSDKILRYAALLHDIAKPDCLSTDEAGIDHFYGHQDAGVEKAKKILRRLKLDNYTIDSVCRLVKYHDYGSLDMKMNAFRRFLGKLGVDNFDEFISIKKADTAGQSEYMREEKIACIDRLVDMYQEVLDKQQCITMKELKITGNDIIGLGVAPGRELGAILKDIFEMVLDSPEINQYETLMKIAKDKIDK